MEWAPFRAAVDAGVDAVMVGHYALPAVTGRRDLPTSVSAAVIDGVIRGDLGFDDLIVTDALDMGALAQGAGSIIEAVAAVRAGIDLLLCSADFERASAMTTALNLAVDRGLLDPARLGQSGARIGRARERLAARTRPAFDPVEAAAVADELARRSITLVRDDPGLLPLEPGSRLAAIMVEPGDLTPADTSSWVPPMLATALAERFGSVHEVVVPRRPDSDDIGRAVAAAADTDAAVVGTIDANPEQAALVSALQQHGPTVVAALRTPNDLARFPTVGTYLCTYGILRPSLDALAAALAGAAPIEGRLPAPIGDLHAVGHGLRR